MVVLLLPSTHDLIAFASCKRIENGIEKENGSWSKLSYFLCGFALRIADFCCLVGYTHVCWALCFSIKRFPSALGRVFSQGMWCSLSEEYECSVSSGHHLGESPFLLTLSTFGTPPLNNTLRFYLWWRRRMISALEENRKLQKFMKWLY